MLAQSTRCPPPTISTRLPRMVCDSLTKIRKLAEKPWASGTARVLGFERADARGDDHHAGDDAHLTACVY